jgi:hypothetical protein
VKLVPAGSKQGTGIQSEAPRLQGGASKRNNIINYYSICIPSLPKRGQGRFFYKRIIHKIPLNLPFPKGDN